MLADERRNRILEVLRDQRYVSVNDLHDALEVSRETIRRDINRLASENRLIKTHGGAESVSREEPGFASRMTQNFEEKKAIGLRAAELVSDNSSVIIDSGTTCLCTAEALMERRSLTIFTNDIHVAGKLADRNENRVYLLGGELLPGEGATVGRDTTAMLSSYFADFAFIGISSMSDEGVLSDYTREVAALRSMMITQARTPVLVGDHAKFGWNAGVRIQEADRAEYLVTNRALKASINAACRAMEIEVLVARG